MGSGLGGAKDAVYALLKWGRPFRARDLARKGIEPAWLNHMILPWIERLDRGVYGLHGAAYPRIAIALVRVNRSVACLGSALWLHGLLDKEPPEAWLMIAHKAWMPTPPPAPPTRFVRTTFIPILTTSSSRPRACR